VHNPVLPKEFDMKVCTLRTVSTAIFIAALLPIGAAHAQLGDLLKKGTESSSSGSLGSLGDIGGMLSGQSITPGSTGNVAGVLEFCMKNNYLGGNSVASVKDGLLGKLSGGSPSSDSGYTSGAQGILNSGDGKQIDLSGGGLKEQVTKQVCDKVLSMGKSLL
jgi:hypothetical protein